jgi:hypothetical protein
MTLHFPSLAIELLLPLHQWALRAPSLAILMEEITSDDFAGAALLKLRQPINWITPALIGELVVRQGWFSKAAS